MGRPRVVGRVGGRIECSFDVCVSVEVGPLIPANMTEPRRDANAGQLSMAAHWVRSVQPQSLHSVGLQPAQSARGEAGLRSQMMSRAAAISRPLVTYALPRAILGNRKMAENWRARQDSNLRPQA
jgi:hypothetical protein